jgi:hypothetical protein
MVPRSKFDRLVLAHRLVEVGLTLVAEAERYAKSTFARAKGIRDGLMIALLALCPIRVTNFAALEIGVTFKEVDGIWWITLPFKSTKTKGLEERPVPDFLNHAIDLYFKQGRPVLIGTRPETNVLKYWVAVHHQKSWNVDFQDHAPDSRSGCVATSLSNGRSDHCGHVWRRQSSPCNCAARTE